MKPTFLFAGLFLLFSSLFLSSCAQPAADPWKPTQLMQPKELAGMITSHDKNTPLIICIGPGALIPGSVNVGVGSRPDNMAKLKTLLEKEKRNRSIVIYCGCCPFRNCPNIRPPFALLNSMGFTNHKLLNLSTSIKADWMDMGYPVQ